MFAKTQDEGFHNIFDLSFDCNGTNTSAIDGANNHKGIGVIGRSNAGGNGRNAGGLALGLASLSLNIMDHGAGAVIGGNPWSRNRCSGGGNGSGSEDETASTSTCSSPSDFDGKHLPIGCSGAASGFSPLSPSWSSTLSSPRTSSSSTKRINNSSPNHFDVDFYQDLTNHFSSSSSSSSSGIIGSGFDSTSSSSSTTSSTSSGEQQLGKNGNGSASSASNRYKTEMCRPFQEKGMCKYGDKCQFAHGIAELRVVSRHPKYKTDLCRTYHTSGFCPYGPRCHFVHNIDEVNNDRTVAMRGGAGSKNKDSSAPADKEDASSGSIKPLPMFSPRSKHL